MNSEFYVLGLPVHLKTNYCNWLLECLQKRIGTHIVTLNSEMTMQAGKDTHLSEIIQNAELVIPDGAGVVLYLQLILKQEVKRCPGIELAENLLQIIGEEKTNTKDTQSQAHTYETTLHVAAPKKANSHKGASASTVYEKYMMSDERVLLQSYQLAGSPSGGFRGRTENQVLEKRVPGISGSP